MNSQKKEILVKIKNAGIFKNNKWLVKDVSLEIYKGTIVSLIGPNGSGKTTTAKIILGIYRDIQGSVERFTKKISYVPQKILIDWSLPIRVVDFMVLTQKLENTEIEEALKLTGAEHLKNNSLSKLSGGELQRVLLARAIAKKPDLLVLDEPVQGVDFTGEAALYELIKKISETLKCGILLISHDLHMVMSSTDFVICLNGHICCSGTPISVAQNKEYQKLFGDHASQILSLYKHNHDHDHSTDGSIKEKIN